MRSDYDDSVFFQPLTVLTREELEYARTFYSFACWCDQHKDCKGCGCECHLIESAFRR